MSNRYALVDAETGHTLSMHYTRWGATRALLRLPFLQEAYIVSLAEMDLADAA